MEFFLNEWSLQSQFSVTADFARATVAIVALVVRAREITRGRLTLYRSDRIDHRSAIGTDPFQKSINALGAEVRDVLLDVVYNKSAPAAWEANRISEPTDAYHWLMPERAAQQETDSGEPNGARPPQPVLVTEDDAPTKEIDEVAANEANEESESNEAREANERDVSDTSMAEITERLLRAAIPTGCLLNFIDSELSGLDLIEIVKNRTAPPTNVASFETVAAFEKWLEGFRGAKPYDAATATRTPLDEETCLADTSLFEPTNRLKQHGRTLYEHRTSRDIYYVDNFHKGASAHLEVFSRMGKHKGEATLDGKLKENTADKDKDYTID